jgi:uncharacterized protein YigA (DUF484 family)
LTCTKGVAQNNEVEGKEMNHFFQILTDSAFLTAISTLFGSVVTYLITKANIKKDVSINDRLQLSKDQYQLIAEMRAMMQEQRDEIDNLREEIKQLQAVNISLIVENKELQTKIAELNIRLSRIDSE